MNKFEKLIEYVINEDDKKAQALFHEIVVEKSRNIYEGLMDQDRIGGDEVDELLNDVEAEENGMHEAEDEYGEEEISIGGDDGGMEMDVSMGDEMSDGEMSDGEYSDMDAEEGELEDRVVDLEDKLDELMAEFDQIVGSDEGTESEFGDEMSGEEEMGMDDEEGIDSGEYEEEPEMEESYNGRGMHFEDEELDEAIVDELHEEDDEDLDESADELEEALKSEIDENVSLTKVSKGIANKTEGQSVGASNEQGVSVNKKTINNDNSGKKGAPANPVNFAGGAEHSNNKKISYKEGDATTEPRTSNVKAPKNSEDGSTNKKSVQESTRRRGRPVGSKNKRTTKRKV